MTLIQQCRIWLVNYSVYAALFFLSIYLIIIAIWRLFLSPLSKIPGPKLAALTGWYETYYQLFNRGGGQYTFKIAGWHQEYGPILRIGPNEVHISDPDFYETIYAYGHEIDKPQYFEQMFGSPGATFSTVDHDLHRIRKSALLPFFSKRKILSQEENLQWQINKLCQRLQDEYADTEKVLNLCDLFSCFTADVVTKYAFDRTYNYLDYPHFISPFTRSINTFKKSGHLAIQFPWIPKLLAMTPEAILEYLNPSANAAFEYKRKMRSQIQDILRSKSQRLDDRWQGTIFTNVIESDLPASELELDRLMDEASGVVGAGIETTKWAAVVTFFHVINSPKALNRLREELETAFPSPHEDAMPIQELESLPWLMACIEEGLRLSYGGVARSPRIFQSKALTYGSYTIPSGTAVSSDAWALHHNESIFPESFEYNPTRWLEAGSSTINPKLSGSSGTKGDTKKNLHRYLASFGKGTRMCLGMHLGYAELELLVANLFTRFDFSLYNTDRTDVDCIRDEIAPGVKRGSRGVRVTVRTRDHVKYGKRI